MQGTRKAGERIEGKWKNVTSSCVCSHSLYIFSGFVFSAHEPVIKRVERRKIKRRFIRNEKKRSEKKIRGKKLKLEKKCRIEEAASVTGVEMYIGGGYWS